MFEKLFLQILNMSFTASFVILAVIVVRLLLKKAPRVISYALWAVVLFRLICPFSFESAISLLPVHANPIPQEIMYQQMPQINTGIPIVNDSVNAVLPAATPDASMNPLQGWLAIGTFLWLCGIAVLAIYSMVSLLLLKRKLRGAICENENVYLADGLASPFVMGLFRPKIYLPASLTDNEKRYILLHEQTHIKRLDHVVKIVGFAVLCLHWFNPLAWIAFFLCGKDMETSCDEAVIKRLGSEIKKEYSSSLLALATGRRIVGGSPLAFGEGDTKSRIKNVLNYKRPAFWVIVVSIIAVVAVGIGLMANPAAQRPAMLWAKNLQVGDIVSVELVTTNGDENSRYQYYEPEQFSDIVKLVNGSRGSYLPQPKAIAGGGRTLYITTRDGVRHSVGNNANVYLEIDGDSFQMSRFTVDGWGRYSNGNAPMPENFWVDDTLTPEPPSDEYNGLSQEEYVALEAERARFESLTAEEQFVFLESGGVSCYQFEHLWWEDSISTELIRFVGADAFDAWAKAQRQQEQCSDIYSFSKRFGLDYSALESLIVENDLTDIYPLERLKARAAVFDVPSESYEDFWRQAMANGLTEEQIKVMENQSMRREDILKMTPDEATKWLEEVSLLNEQFNLHELGLQLFEYFRANPAINLILANEPGITDEEISAFAIQQLLSENPVDFDFEKGFTRQEFDAVCQKHFGRVLESYNNSKIRTLPSGNIISTGWSPSSFDFILKEYTQQPDGRYTAIFYQTYMPMGEESRKPYEIFDAVSEDITNKRLDDYGEIRLIEMEFEMIDPASAGMHLRYYDVRGLGIATF